MKLLVTDYDGTLFIDESDIKENIKHLKKWQENGNLIMISTGRSYPSIKNQVDIYNIPYDYLSCADGSIIYDKNSHILKMYEMNKEIVETFKKFYQGLNYEEIQFSYPTGYANILLNNKNLLGINICLSNENYTKKTVNDFDLMSKKYPDYHFLKYMHTNFSYLCIKPKGIDKSSTVDYLKDELNLNENDIYIIGDSDNDVEMIKKYHGVGMNISCPSILNIVKKLYPSVRDFIEDIN